MSASQVHIAGIGVSTSSQQDLTSGAIEAGTKALLDAGVTYAKVQMSVACSLADGQQRIPQACFKAFGKQKAPTCSMDSHSALYMIAQCVRSGQADCAMVIGLDTGSPGRSGNSAQTAAVAVILVSDRFLVSHAFLQDSAVRIRACTLATEGSTSRTSISSTLRQAGVEAQNIQLVETQGSDASRKNEVLRDARLEGTLGPLGPLKDFDVTGLAGLCGIVWRLRGWIPEQGTQLHNCLQHTSAKEGQTVTVVLCRSDGQPAPGYKDVQNLRDGRERLGYNPAGDTKDIGWRMEGVKSREGDRMPIAGSGERQLTTRGGDRAALARLQRSIRAAEKRRLEIEYLSWDWEVTPEETACQSGISEIGQDPIPHTVHFILIAQEGKHAELEFYQYLAIKAALLRIEPDNIKVHSYLLNETGTWWQLIKHRVTLVAHEPRQTLRTVDGRVHKLRLPHQTDIIRLEILHHEGGIYLDTDVYAFQSFEPLLRSPTDLLMGHEGGNRSGIGNAVIVARPGSSFIARWLATYNESFDNRPQMWNHHSVKVPAELAVQLPRDICKLSPSTFFWPTWSSEHIKMMHLPVIGEEAIALKSNMSQYKGAMYENQLAYHAWGNIARANFLSQLTPEKLFSIESRFNILLRDIYLAEV